MDPVFELEIYITREGEAPFSRWLQRLDVQARAKIRVKLDRVQLGNLGESKFVGKGVHELKIDYGPGYRVYFGKKGQKIILLLWGGNKQRQQADIERAQKYWEDCERRFSS